MPEQGKRDSQNSSFSRSPAPPVGGRSETTPHTDNSGPNQRECDEIEEANRPALANAQASPAPDNVIHEEAVPSECADPEVPIERQDGGRVANRAGEGSKRRPNPLEKTWDDRWFEKRILPGPHPGWEFSTRRSSQDAVRAYRKEPDPDRPSEPTELVFKKQVDAPYTATGLGWATDKQSQARFIMSRHGESGKEAERRHVELQTQYDDLKRKMEERKFWARLLRVKEHTFNWFLDKFEELAGSIEVCSKSIIANLTFVVTWLLLTFAVKPLAWVAKWAWILAPWVILFIVMAIIGWGLTHDWLRWMEIGHLHPHMARPSIAVPISLPHLARPSISASMPPNWRFSDRILPWLAAINAWIRTRAASGNSFAQSVIRLLKDVRAIVGILFSLAVVALCFLLFRHLDALRRVINDARTYTTSTFSTLLHTLGALLRYLWDLISESSIQCYNYAKGITARLVGYVSHQLSQIKHCALFAIQSLKNLPSYLYWGLRNPISFVKTTVPNVIFAALGVIVMLAGNTVEFVLTSFNACLEAIVQAIQKVSDAASMIYQEISHFLTVAKIEIVKLLKQIRQRWKYLIITPFQSRTAQYVSWQLLIMVWTASMFLVGFFCGLGYREWQEGFENVVVEVLPCGDGA